MIDESKQQKHVATLVFVVHERHIQKMGRIQVPKKVSIFDFFSSSEVDIAPGTTPIIHDHVATIGEHCIERTSKRFAYFDL